MNRKFRVSSVLSAVGALGLMAVLSACPANDPAVFMGVLPQSANGGSVVALQAFSGCAPLTWTASTGAVSGIAGAGATLTMPPATMVDQAVSVTATCGAYSDTHVITLKAAAPVVSLTSSAQAVAGLGTVSLTAAATLGCTDFTWATNLGALSATTGKTVTWTAPAATVAAQTANITAKCGTASRTVTLSVNPATTGSLQVTITGLNGVNAHVWVAGPMGLGELSDMGRTLTATDTLTGLTPGIYYIEAHDVSTPSQVKYMGRLDVGWVVVSAGQTAVAGVAYYIGKVTLSADRFEVYGGGAVTLTAASNFRCTNFTYAISPADRGTSVVGVLNHNTTVWTALATAEPRNVVFTATCDGVTSNPVTVSVKASQGPAT